MADESRSSSSSDSETGSEPERKQSAVRLPQPAGNVFKNDGSFMEMFKKMQDERNRQDNSYFGNPPNPSSTSGDKQNSEPSETVQTDDKPYVTEETPQSSSIQQPKKPSVMSFVGKRRGGRVLPTGIVKKPKKPDQPQEEGEKNDAWSRYLSEVRKYREQSCEEEGKRRPLVK